MKTNKPTLWQVIKSVFAAFIGVQSDKNRRLDFQSDSIAPFVVVGLAMAASFVVGLILLVRWVS